MWGDSVKIQDFEAGEDIWNKKEPFDELKTGWMSPGGDFYPCEYMGHLAVADEIWNELYNEEAPSDVDRRLVRLGWCEIHCMTFLEHGFLFNFEKHLTPEQRFFIKPVFE